MDDEIVEEFNIIKPAPKEGEYLFVETEKDWKGLETNDVGIPIDLVVQTDSPEPIQDYRPVSPFPSWVFDDSLEEWVAPVSAPSSTIQEQEDGTKMVTEYLWNEDRKEWVQNIYYLPAPIVLPEDPDYYDKDGNPMWNITENLGLPIYERQDLARE